MHALSKLPVVDRAATWQGAETMPQLPVFHRAATWHGAEAIAATWVLGNRPTHPQRPTLEGGDAFSKGAVCLLGAQALQG
jgi:hypothetical protein